MEISSTFSRKLNETMKSKEAVTFFIGFLFLSISSFAKDINSETSQIRYFKEFYTNYSHPFFVKNEINKNEIKNFTTYFTAEFDDRDRIVEFKKFYNADCVISISYTYENNGRLKSIRNNIKNSNLPLPE